MVRNGLKMGIWSLVVRVLGMTERICQPAVFDNVQDVVQLVVQG